ncbi:hypothetical protein [Roseibium polysiphoniae]|uniref:Uncharacterized protein n=1 Tax=Roseibium polysiphoniae TaxID=2571221 RepID=A0A944CA45_9HYPH|nr:hypothetical protein [Roseibium polysiphoniae]MBS8258717.1 hypothetical protein [Roseibium polysiphoniae]
MGTLLDFASAQRPLSRLTPKRNDRRSATSAPSGEVVLFPGVRYEREALDLAARIGTIGRTAGTLASDLD